MCGKVYGSVCALHDESELQNRSKAMYLECVGISV